MGVDIITLIHAGKFRNAKLYDLGDSYELFIYRSVWSRVPRVNSFDRGYSWKSSEKYQERHRMRVLKKRGDLRRLIKKYKLTRLCTLTFAENLTDVCEADKEFNRFVTNLKNYVKGLSYVAVREFQRRGAVHYHILFNCYIPQPLIERLWGRGFVSIKQVSLKSAINYLSKYLVKSADDERLQGHRIILRSRHLFIKVETFLVTQWDKILSFFAGVNIEFMRFYEFDWGSVLVVFANSS